MLVYSKNSNNINYNSRKKSYFSTICNVKHNIYEPNILHLENKYNPFGLLLKINKSSYIVCVYNHTILGKVQPNTINSDITTHIWSISKNMFDSEYIRVNQQINVTSQIHNLLLYKQIMNKYKYYYINCPSSIIFVNYDKIIIRYNALLKLLLTKIIYPGELITNILDYI